MTTELRNTGISVVGEVGWGTHLCHFYETKQDLLDTLVPYFKAGLEKNEFCLWMVSDSEVITVEEAKAALARAVPDLDRHISDENIEILSGHEWYFEKNVLNLESVMIGWDDKLRRALARGYDGLRASADTFWLADKDRRDFLAYEKQVNDWITDQRMTVVCTYPLSISGAAEVLDVVQVHQFAVARRQGEWEVLETPELMQAKAEIKKLNDELEQRVIERTNELRVANEELRKEITERKQAEASLHAKEQEFRAIVENAPDQIIRYDREFRRVYINPSVAQFYGRPAESLIGKPLGSGLLEAGLDAKEDDLAQVRQRISAVFDTGKSYEFEMTWPMPAGRVYFSVRLFPELDLNGSVINVLGIARDITERQCAEDALRRSEDRIRLIIDTIPTMAWSIGPDGVVDFLNQRWIDYTGLSLERFIEEPMRPIHPDDVPRVMERWRAAREVGEPYDNEMRLRRADGEYRWFLIRTAPLRDAHGNLVKWYGVSIDIEDRKQAEEKLKQSESQLAEAQRLARVGSWNWDLNSNTLDWSDELYRIFGIDPQAYNPAYEDFVMELVHAEDRAFVRGVIQSALKTHEPFSFFNRIVRPDGEERVIHAQGNIARDEHGSPIRAFGTAQDVTELKHAEQKLKATSEQLRALSARVQLAREEEGTRIAREIHDEFGSALTSLRWDLEMIEKTISEAVDRSQVPILRKRIADMLELTDTTINSVRRIASELRPSVLDDFGLVTAIRWQARQFQERTGIVVHCDCSLDDIDLNQEQSTALFRIFQEALTNILRHAHATRVDVTMVEKSGTFVLMIGDNGRGITEDEKSGQLSIGLLGMRERALLVGGEIDIRGAAGEGTSITVRLPIVRSGKHSIPAAE